MKATGLLLDQSEHPRSHRPLALYNLDAILAVGYRVRSPRGVQFRSRASTVLKEYLLRGFAMDDERLKNPDGRPGSFDEMLARIRDIRAFEKRFSQKVRDLFALSSDYDKSDQATRQFFATVQNLLLHAVTRMTAAELVTARAHPDDEHFGLLAWKGARVRKQDIPIVDVGDRDKTRLWTNQHHLREIGPVAGDIPGENRNVQHQRMSADEKIRQGRGFGAALPTIFPKRFCSQEERLTWQIQIHKPKA